VQGFENRVACAVRHEQPGVGMDQRLRHADSLSSQLGIDFVKLLSVAYNSNPSGVGLL
jgi:hypothetical protein